MSKRFIVAQQSGDRKKPRLDISVTDHNFPLSQNAGFNNVADHFDDIDDELLLQASQACEQACNASVLPAYSQFIPPALTSTQLTNDQNPSTSKAIFSYKKPTASLSNTIARHLKDKCISSPLRGISNGIGEIETTNLRDNFFNDKVTQDTDYVYRQLLQFKEENAKLKSENGKLLEKCVTKEGEASILRTQLKTCQVSVDNARLEKLKTQEQAQIHWSEKLNTVNKQLSDLMTQLDSKNLEIISMKEKCKMLESNKIKVTQVTVAGNDISRMNNSVIVSNNFLTSQPKRFKTVSINVQTDNNPQFLKLCKPCRIGRPTVTQILPLIMDSAVDKQHSMLDYSEKLKKPVDFSPNKCRILSTFYRPSGNTDYISSKSKIKINMSSIHEDLVCIAACNGDFEKIYHRYINIFKTTKIVLESVEHQLEMISKRLTSAFQKEMDKRYMESTMVYVVVLERDLIVGKAIFKGEQSILARRMTAVLQYVLADNNAVQFFNEMQRAPNQISVKDKVHEVTLLLIKICSLLDNNCCALFYSGLVLSIILLLETLVEQSHADTDSLLEIVKYIVSSRAMLFVPCRLLRILCTMKDINLNTLCSGNVSNLKFDYDQGVILYKKDSCLLQVLLRQMETSLKCMERQKLMHQVVETTRGLLQLYTNVTSSQNVEQEKSRCKCGNLLVQIIVYALKICSTMLDHSVSKITEMSPEQIELLSVCRSGLQLLYQCTLRDAEFTSQLGYNEGYLVQFCEQLNRFRHNEFHSTMLMEMIGTLQAVAEDVSESFHRHAWLQSFRTFSLAD